MTAFLPLIMIILPYLLKIVDFFIAKKAGDEAAQAASVALAKSLEALGVKGLKSRFDQEADQKQSINDQWAAKHKANAEAAAAAAKPEEKK